MMTLLLLGVALADPVVLDDGRAVHAIISAQTFNLEQSYRYDWSAAHPAVSEGLLLELDVDPAWLKPSDTRQAVLYAGAVPVERLNTGWPSGRLWVIVPGPPAGELLLYFGGYELPETVTEAQGRDAEAEARKRGLKPLQVPPSAPVRVKGQGDLYRLAGE